MTSSDPGAGHSVEQAIAVVRIVLAAFSSVTLVTIGAARPRAGLIGPVALAAAIVAGAVVLSLIGLRAPRGSRSRWPIVRVVWLQGLETAWFVGLAIALQLQVMDAAWALLVVPIVVASLRLTHLAVAGTWVLGSAGYAAASIVGAVGEPQQILERLGVLLAVAACMALLTRWLQVGWQVQRELTEAAEERLRRLSVVEQAARAMREVEPDAVVDSCVAHGPRLGFAATTASKDAGSLSLAGDGEVVPVGAVFDEPESGVVSITRWSGSGGEVVYSASVLEPGSGNVIAGWQIDEIDDSMAAALGDLVANTTNALQAARHLERSRIEASRDPLTRLANRTELHRNLDVAAATDEPAALFFIDLDHFKTVNDTHGHLVGDGLLIALANRLKKAVGGHGVAARFGGDEFVVLITGPLVNEANALGNDIRETLAEPFAIEGLRLTITVSVGVALTQGSFDPATLLETADKAAYAAKLSGRNAVETAEPTVPQQFERPATPR